MITSRTLACCINVFRMGKLVVNVLFVVIEPLATVTVSSFCINQLISERKVAECVT